MCALVRVNVKNNAVNHDFIHEIQYWQLGMVGLEINSRLGMRQCNVNCKQPYL